MFAEHKKKFIAGIAVAFLAAFAVFYENVVALVNYTFISEETITEQTDDAADAETETDAETEATE